MPGLASGSDTTSTRTTGSETNGSDTIDDETTGSDTDGSETAGSEITDTRTAADEERGEDKLPATRPRVLGHHPDKGRSPGPRHRRAPPSRGPATGGLRCRGGSSG